MRILQLTLQPYRNFEAFELDLDQKRVLIVGANGRGKSNILEAVSYLSLGKSIRGGKDREGIPHGGAYFDIRAQWHDGERERHLRVFYSDQEGKRVFLDSAPLGRISDVLTLFQSVHFSPEDVALVLQFTARRRRLLDILISQSSASYLRDLQRYQRVVTQRNRWCRNWSSEGRDELLAWDAQLSRLGGAIRRRRLETLMALQELLAPLYERFSRGREAVTLTYRDREINGDIRAAMPSAEALSLELQEELVANRDQERRAGHTLCGPHRDSFGFTLNGEAAHVFASQGQQKSILVSWKMAEAQFLESQSGQQPVLLLDDVFSELDGERTAQLLDLVEGFDQVVVTTPGPLSPMVAEQFTEVTLDA